MNNNLLGYSEGNEFKDLRQRMFQGSYVDNFFVGCMEEEGLGQCHDYANRVFGDNGFYLQQFSTNSMEYQEK